MDVLEGATGNFSEAGVTCDDDDDDGDGNEVSIEVKEVIDIKKEVPEDISFPPIKTEHEVRQSPDSNKAGVA